MYIKKTINFQYASLLPRIASIRRGTAMISTLDISRIQFAMTITFHIIFPALSIGLATYITVVEAMWLKTKKPILYQTCRFWTKILALTFGMGIISGLAMEFQIGTNWAGFSKIVGPVLGVLFVSEALTAFFIEATFLGFMLFGWGRINKYLHFFCSFMVWVGVMLSAFWILAANSWMQTPAGVNFIHGKFVVTSWWHVIFNPSTIIRYTHMILAAYIATAMVVLAVACFYLLRKQYKPFALFNLKFILCVVCILMPLQIFIGDEVGLKVHQYQPIKTAAIEGLWNTTKGAPLLLFADIKQKQRKNGFNIAIPHMASVINTHHWDGKLIGLNSVKPSYQPYVPLVFYSFRVMVGLGFIILIFAFVGITKTLRHKLASSPWFLKLGVLLAPSGLLALIAGWYTAETGRQPWVVYNIVSTASAVSDVSVSKVVIGFSLIVVIYGIIFGYFYNRYLFKTIQTGPAIYGIEPPKNPIPWKKMLDTLLDRRRGK